MFGVLVLSQGGLAGELVGAAETVAGRAIPVEALEIEWGVSPAEAREIVGRRLREMSRGEGVLLLTPVFGDTATNVAVSLSEPGRYEVVAGVNLPMLLRVGCQNLAGVSVSEAARLIEEKGRQSVGRATASTTATTSGTIRAAHGDQEPCA
jgi:PTS system mannose-specific IIA component